MTWPSSTPRRPREAAGGTAAVEAAIDLMVAETNGAYAASGVRQRRGAGGSVGGAVCRIVRRRRPDIVRLADPEDGHLDEAHALRDRTGADLVHLIVAESNGVCGIADLLSASSDLTALDCGGITFAHELGHNMGLRHDRFQGGGIPRGERIFASGVRLREPADVRGGRPAVQPLGHDHGLPYPVCTGRRLVARSCFVSRIHASATTATRWACPFGAGAGVTGPGRRGGGSQRHGCRRRRGMARSPQPGARRDRGGAGPEADADGRRWRSTCRRRSPIPTATR